MRKSWRIPVVCLFVLGALGMVMGLRAQEKAPIAEQVAKAYGLDAWTQLDAVRCTFNVNMGRTIKLARSGVWERKTGKVRADGMTKDGKPLKVTYLRSEL